MTASTDRRGILSLTLRAVLAVFLTTVFASSASAQLVLQVQGSSSATPIPFEGTIGTFFLQLTATGGSGDYTFSLTPGAANVPGLRIRNRPYPMPTFFPPSTPAAYMGVLNTQTGSPFATSFRVTDKMTGQIDDQEVTITVRSLQVLNNSTIPRPVVGTPYDFAFQTIGLVGTAAWSLNSPAATMPPGLSINPTTGVVEGTPTTAGTFNPVIKLTDTPSGIFRTLGLTIVVNPFDILSTTSNNALPDATINAFYSTTISAPNCVSCVFTITQGSIPGLTLATNGVLSGTPFNTSSGNTIGITATGTNGVALENFLLRVQSNTVQPLQITSAPVITATAGNNTNSSVFAFGGTLPYAITVDSGALPPGISLVPDGAAVSTTLTPGVPMLTGRAMVPGTYNFTLKVTDNGGVTAYRAFTWIASRLNINYFSLPLAGTTLAVGTPYDQRLLALGGSGTYAFSTTGVLPGGLAFDPAVPGRIFGTPTDTGSFTVLIQVDDVNNPGSFVTSNVTFNIAGPPGNTNLNINGLNNITTLSRGQGFSTNLTGSGGTGPYTFSENPGSTLPPGFTLLPQGSPASVTGAAALFGAALQAGTFDFTLKVTDSTLPTPNVGVRTFRMVVTDMTFITNSLKPGAVGAAYSQRLLAVGGTAPLTYSLDTGFVLPAGLQLGASGNITGTPTQETSQSLTFVATDANGKRITRAFTLTISNLGISTLGIAGDLLPLATSGVPYNYQFTCVTACPGATWTITGGFLPFGLTLSAGGAISGTTFLGFPQSNEFSIFVTVTSGGRSVTRRFALDVLTEDPWPLSGAPNPVLQDQLVGQITTINLSLPIGGTPPYTYALAPGSSLPPGLQLAAGAGRVAPTFSPTNTLITGVPTTAGVYTFDLDISDSSVPVQTIRRTFTLAVSNIAITTGTTNGIPAPRVGVAYEFQFTTVGGSGTYSYQVDPATNFQGISSLPPGLTLTSGGLLSGMPTGSGVYTFRVVVTDTAPLTVAGGANTFSRFYTVTVADFINGGPGGLFIGVGSASGAITTPNPADTPVGVWAEPFFTLFRLSGGPPVAATWSLVGGSLPPGLALMGDQLLGRPSTAGVYVYKLRGTDNANPSQFAEHEYTMRITPMQVVNPATTISFGDRVSLPNAQVGADYAFRIRVAGGTGPYTFSLAVSPTFGNIVPGLTLDSTGLLSGNPTQSGVFFVGFIVQDSSVPAKKFVSAGQMQLIVAPAGGRVPLIVEKEIVADSPIPLGVEFGGSFLSYPDLFVQSGVKPFTWTVAQGSSLPPGAALVSGGGVVSDIIAGKATTPGTYSFTLNVEDGAGRMASVHYTNVRVTSLAISPLRLPTGVMGTPYNAALTLSGGTPPYGPITFIDGSSVPPGLTMSPTGVISGTPTAAGNYLLAAFYGDSAPSMEYTIYRLTIDTPNGEAKGVSLAPSVIELTKPQGTGLVTIPLNVNITNGNPAFTAVLTGIPGSLSATTGNAPAALNVNLDLSSLTSGTYHGMVGVKVPGAANSYEVTPITVTIGPTPVVQAIASTPNSGSGIHQIFSLTYSDSAGVTADLNGAFVQFRNVANPALICRIQHRAITGQVRLLGDDNATWSPFTSYGAGTLSNSLCSLNLATSTATPSGNNLTLSLDITFTPAFAGPATIGMRAQSLAGPNTGFLAKGTFTVGSALAAVSITPNSGTGVSQTFAAVFTDSLGVSADLLRARVRFGPNGIGTCVVDYDAIANKVRMLDDSGTAGPFVNLGSGTLSNSQCILDLTQTNGVPSGTSLTVNLALTFTPSFAGPHPVSLRAVSNFGGDTGWLLRGTWDVNAVQAISITPVNGSSAGGAAQPFVLEFSDSEGVAADLLAARVRFRTASGVQCNISYNAVLNQVRVMDNAGVLGPFMSFGVGTYPDNNSQCTLDLASSSAVRNGNDLTLVLSFTFKATFANSVVGAKNVDMLATSSVGWTTGWVNKGTWTVTP